MSKETVGYTPGIGDEVVIYINRFKNDTFQQGLKIIDDELSPLLQNTHLTTLTQFYHNHANKEVGAIQYFRKGSRVEDWFNNKERNKIVGKLEPLLREPLIVHRFSLDRHVLGGAGK